MSLTMKGSAALSMGHHQRDPFHPKSSSVSPRAALSTTFVVLCLIWFFLSGAVHVSSVHENAAGRSASSRISTERLKRYLKLVARDAKHQQPHSRETLDLNYVSKRRVPNGPDPIHNRKAVKYRQPPGA